MSSNKFALSSIYSSSNWLKKIDPTVIPEPRHSHRKDLNVGYLPFSEREPVIRYLEKKPFTLPPGAVVVDLSHSTSSSTKTNYHKDKSPIRTPRKMLSKSRIGPQRRSKPRPHKRSKIHSKEREIIDLTVPSSLEAIREQNQLYFSYDPRGVSSVIIPEDYCMDCKCPVPYCADKVFGIHCNQYMERLVGRMGFHYHKREKDILWDYHSHYVCMLEMKLSFNNIRVGNFSFDRDAELPMCVKQGSYATFLNDLKLWKNGESDTEKETISIVEFVNDDDITNGLPPLLKRQDTYSDDDESDNHKVDDDMVKSKDRRTLVEQASDIGAAFKLMKSYVQKKRTDSKVVNPYKK